MTLTNKEIKIAQYLVKKFKLEKQTIIPIGLMMETEEQREQLIDFLEKNDAATESDILQRCCEIIGAVYDD